MLRGINSRTIGDTFYSRLFHDNASLRKMFPADMEGQYQKLMDMLNAIVSRIDRLEEMSDEIAAMARRHAGYGARPGHYKLVGNALLWTLKQGLGSDWNPEVEQAWKECYGLLAGKMIKATQEDDAFAAK